MRKLFLTSSMLRAPYKYQGVRKRIMRNQININTTLKTYDAKQVLPTKTKKRAAPIFGFASEVPGGKNALSLS